MALSPAVRALIDFVDSPIAVFNHHGICQGLSKGFSELRSDEVVSLQGHDGQHWHLSAKRLHLDEHDAGQYVVVKVQQEQQRPRVQEWRSHQLSPAPSTCCSTRSSGDSTTPAAVLDGTSSRLNIIHANQGLCAITGCSTDELVGRSFEDVHGQHDTAAQVYSQSEPGTACNHEVFIRGPPGQGLQQALVHLEPFKAPLTGSTCFLATYGDIHPVSSRSTSPAAVPLAAIMPAAAAAEPLAAAAARLQASSPLAFTSPTFPRQQHPSSLLPPPSPPKAAHPARPMAAHLSAVATMPSTPSPPAAAPAPAAAAAGASAGLMQQLGSAAFSCATTAMVVLDTSRPGLPIVYWNTAFAELLHLPAEWPRSLPGHTWSVLHCSDTDPATAAHIELELRAGRCPAAELLCCSSTGRRFWASVRSSFLCNTAGQRTPYAVLVTADLTASKAAEALHLLRDHALSNLREGISIADPNLPDMPIIYVNDAFLEMTGYSRSEVLGRNCRFLQGPETDPEAVDAIRAAIHSKQAVTVELANYTKSGAKFWNLLSITPVLDAAGRLMSLIGVQSNITELMQRKEAEKELLEAKVAAETATEAKSLFLANMSHEIRTPLNGMIATAQLLMDSGLSPEQVDLTETLLESGSTLLGILGDILDFSRIEHSSIELQLEPMSLLHTVEACLDIVAAEAGKKGVELSYIMAPSVARCLVLADSIRVRQVVANMLSNAVKFTEQGEVLVEVAVEEVEEEEEEEEQGAEEGGRRSRVRISVMDTGIGIPDACKSRLFQCFRQGSMGMARKYGGTGLGLAISKRLAEVMDGTIWVDSTPGQGSTFHFTMMTQLLPTEEVATASTSSASSSSASTIEAGSDGSSSSGSGSGSPQGPPPQQQVGMLVTNSGRRSSLVSPALPCSTLGQESSTLRGLTLLVDMPHLASAKQCCLSAQLLGMRPQLGSSALPETQAYDVAVVSTDRVALALRAGWKGRPLVAVGSKDSLPPFLHPLVALLSKPVKHQKLAAALVKAAVLLPGSEGPAAKRRLPVAGTSVHQRLAVQVDGLRRVSLDNSALLARNAGQQAAGSRRSPWSPPKVDPLVGRSQEQAAQREQQHQEQQQQPRSYPLPPVSERSVGSSGSSKRSSYDAYGRAAAAAADAAAAAADAAAAGPADAAAPACMGTVLMQQLEHLQLLKVEQGDSAEAGQGATPSTPQRSPAGAARAAAAATFKASPPASGRSSFELVAPSAAGGALQEVARQGPYRLQQSSAQHSHLGSSSALPTLHPAAQPQPAAPLPAAQQVPQQVTTPTQQPAQYPAPRAPQMQQQQQQQRTQQPPLQQQQPVLQPQAPPYPSPRILIAEDNKINQKVALKVLQQVLHGCAPDVVENGLQVLTALERTSYDIILMDIHMPEMDGLEASRRIRELYKPHERPRIIALSADTLQALHDRCREVGIEEFIVKPFRVEDLRRVVRCAPRRPASTEQEGKIVAPCQC